VNSIGKQNLIGGRYSLHSPLGSGGMAEIFLARDEVLERDVALKILKERYATDEGFVERFRREALNAASLNHPHIVAVYDWGRSEDDGAYYMAMEYAPGGTLKDYILRDGALPVHKAVEIASQIAWALQAAHERGVVHRDVKPQNVLLSGSGNVKVADFGISRAASATTTSRSRPILGTANYMSPEQAKGETVGPRSDLYSLGVVLFEMLTGELPYKADTPAAVTMKHITEPPRSPREANPKVPEEIDALTRRLLAKDPADRYGSAAELLEDLQRVREGLPPAFVDAEQGTALWAALPVLPVLEDLGGDGESGEPYVVYGRRFRKSPLMLAPAFVALLIVLGAAIWGPWWSDSQEQQAQAREAVGGSPDGVGKGSERGKSTARPKEEASDAGGLFTDEGPESSEADTGSPKLASLSFLPSDPVKQDVVEQEPKAGTRVEPGTEVNTTISSEPEQVSVPEVSGESVEEAKQALSDAGHLVAGTATRGSTEPAGTVIGTDPPTGSRVKRGTAVSILVSSGAANEEGSDDGKEAAPAPAPEVTSELTRLSGSRKREQTTYSDFHGS
jgi:eukaryotic-like serine/threonine-protein kinase